MQEFDRFLYNGGFAVVSISTLLVIMTAVHPGTLLNRFVLSQPILVWIGVRSSLYLWHWPIFVFTRPGSTSRSGCTQRSSCGSHSR